MPPPESPDLVAPLLAVIATLRETIESLRTDNRKLVAMVEGLTRQLDQHFGEEAEARRVELQRLREEAAALALATPPTDPKMPAAGGEPQPVDPPAPVKPPTKRSKHGRGALPENLERDTKTVTPDDCEHCGGTQLWPIETRVTDEFEYVRAYLRIRSTHRRVCQCAACKKVTTPPLPPMPFDRAACTFSLMSWLLYSRGGLFMPLDRLCREFQRMGARIPSATLNRWWARGADLLIPVAAAVRMSLLGCTHIRSDGTGLRVVYPRMLANPKKGEARDGVANEQGYLVPRAAHYGQVLVFGDDEHTVYHFTVDKTGSQIDAFLTLGLDANNDPILWKGTRTADASSVYDHLYVGGDRIESGCNGHALRKFRDDKDKAPLLATRAMDFIGRFFTVEEEAKAKELRGAALLTHRTTYAGPVAIEFKQWLEDHRTDLVPSHPIRKAMQYFINHWEALTWFLVDPEVGLENNWSERALRKLALFRNASMFVGGEDGARRLCVVLTLVQTARQLGLDPVDYMEWALQRTVAHRDNRGIRAADLTPAAYKAAQKVKADHG